MLFEDKGEVDINRDAKEGREKRVLELRNEIVEGERPTQEI